MGQAVRQRKGVLWLRKDVDIVVVNDGKLDLQKQLQ